MNAAVIQTLWADVIACTLRDAGVSLVVISPGSRSTPLVAALERAKTDSFALVTIIDERAAAFYALGAARATGKPAALVCTSGSAAAHYLPAIVEAAHAGIPLIAITADRPPELQDCGASQTIDQHAIYGGFVRGAFHLGAPTGEPLALRAVRRSMIQAITRSLGPDPGPVHINVPLRKPLEPAQPATAEERALAATVDELLIDRPLIAVPQIAPDGNAIDELVRAIATEPRGLIVVGALAARGRELAIASASASRAIDDTRSVTGLAHVAETAGSRGLALPFVDEVSAVVCELARRSGYPIVAEAGSQLRLRARPDDVTFVDAFDVIASHAPRPAVIIQLGAEPVAAAWPAFLASAHDAKRFVLAGPRWHDAESSAAAVILGEVTRSVRALADGLGLAERTSGSLRRRVERDAASLAWREDWRALDDRGRDAVDRATREVPANEVRAIRDAIAALPGSVAIQVGNSLPIRTIDHALAALSSPRAGDLVLTQRGAAGIDGLIASAAGATRAGKPVLLILGDVSFAHDLGGLLAAREAVAPLAILVIDNAGGRIFDGLPVAKADLGDAFAQHWTTAPAIDVVAVARALGLDAITASPSSIGYDVVTAATAPGAAVSVIHLPVSPTGARDVRARAIELAQPAAPTPRISQQAIAIARSSGPVIATGERT